MTFLPKITNELISNICSEVVKILLDTCKYITRLPYPLRRIDTSSSINSSNQEMCYNDNDLSTLYCCLYCCFALLFLLLSLAYSRLCYHGVLLYSFLCVVLLVLVVALVVVVCRQRLLLGHRPSFVVIRLHLLVAITVYCCFVCVALCHIVLFLLLFVLLFCVVVLVVVLASLQSQCIVVSFVSRCVTLCCFYCCSYCCFA